MVEVVQATKEETDAFLARQGITAGKIKTGSVTRERSGKKTYRDSSGNVERTEEPVVTDEGRATRITTYEKTPDLMSSPGTGGIPTTPELYDASGRQLSPFEAYAVSQAPMTDARSGDTVYVQQNPRTEDKRLFGDSVYENYPYLAAQKEAEVRERVFSPATAIVRDVAKKESFSQRTENALKHSLSTAITEQEFSQARSNLRGFQKYELLKDRESYGDIESKNPLKKVAGGFSLGLKTVGQATENLLFEQEEKLRFKDRQAVGTDETGVYALNVLKDGVRSASIPTLKVVRNVIGGAVTDTGSSPLQGALFAASGVLGGVVGAVKGSGLAAKTSSMMANSVVVRSAVRGTGMGIKTLGVGALGVAGYQAAASPDPVGQVSRLGGRVLAFSAAFKAGEAGGYGLGMAAKNTAQAISKTISSVEFPSQPLGKKGAAFRGSRRVSPRSKVQLRQESRGVVQQQKKGARISQDKGETIIKIRDKNVKKFYESQIKGSQVKEVRIKGKPAQYKLTESGKKVLSRQPQNVRAEVILKRGDYFRIEYVNKPGFRKPVKVSTPVYGKSSSSSGNQKVLFRTEKQIQDLSPGVTQQKTFKINDQKVFVRGDPARSQYAAQNIRNDPLRADLTNQPPVPAQVQALRGFRPGVSKTSIFGEERSLYLGSGLRDVRGAMLPPGNLPRTIYEPSVTGLSSSNLVTGVYIPLGSASSIKNESFDVVALGSSSRTESFYRVAQNEAVASDAAVVTDITPALTNDDFYKTSGGGGGRGRGLPVPPPVNPIFEPVSPAPPTPSPFSPRNAVPPREPANPFIPPAFRFRRGDDPLVPGFDVEARIGGIFKRVSSSPLSLKDAVGFGSSYVGGSPAASFRVSPAGRPATGRFFGLSQIGDFDVRPGGLFVEKREKRINTPGELSGITMKGQAAIRRRRMFGRRKAR